MSDPCKHQWWEEKLERSCPWCCIEKLETERDKWQSKAHHQNKDNLMLQAENKRLRAVYEAAKELSEDANE